MAVEFNKYANNYNLLIGKEASKKAEVTIEEEAKDCSEKQISNFKGLENETDLLTQNIQALYGVKINKSTIEDKEIAQETNKILAQLGFNFKVDAEQVASVANGVKNVVLPGLQLAEDGNTALHIADPNGPFADLFA
jgi:hypothetical protein